MFGADEITGVSERIARTVTSTHQTTPTSSKAIHIASVANARAMHQSEGAGRRALNPLDLSERIALLGTSTTKKTHGSIKSAAATSTAESA